jgi:hypothetical protein
LTEQEDEAAAKQRAEEAAAEAEYEKWNIGLGSIFVGRVSLNHFFLTQQEDEAAAKQRAEEEAAEAEYEKWNIGLGSLLLN